MAHILKADAQGLSDAYCCTRIFFCRSKDGYNESTYYFIFIYVQSNYNKSIINSYQLYELINSNTWK